MLTPQNTIPVVELFLAAGMVLKKKWAYYFIVFYDIFFLSGAQEIYIYEE